MRTQDRHLFPVFSADLIDDMKQHIFHRITMIRVPTASAKNCVNHIPTPVNLQGMESLDLLVRLYDRLLIVGYDPFPSDRADFVLVHRRSLLKEQVQVFTGLNYLSCATQTRVV